MDPLLASEPSQPRSYAPQSDFESHKDTISHLYMDSNLILDDVIKEMEQQHKFIASRRQYMKKFKEWGLIKSPSKNRKDKGSCEAVEENDKHDILGHAKLDEVTDYKTDQEASDKPVFLPSAHLFPFGNDSCVDARDQNQPDDDQRSLAVVDNWRTPELSNEPSSRSVSSSIWGMVSKLYWGGASSKPTVDSGSPLPRNLSEFEYENFSHSEHLRETCKTEETKSRIFLSKRHSQALFRDFSPPVPILQEEKNSESHPSNSGSTVTSSDEGREHFLEDETQFSNSPFPDSPQSEARVAMILPVLSPAKTALVDRVMEEFHLIFDYNSGVRVHANGDSPNNRPGSDDPQPNQSADQNSCRDKRKIGDRKSFPPEDSDRDEPNKRPKPNSRKSDQENGSGRRFACPYYKRSPDRHSANTSCVHPGFSSVYRLKEHLYRKHALPIECPRCCQSFGSEEDCREHLRTSQACEMRFKVQRDGFNKDQETKLRSKKRSRIPLTEEEKWKAVWQILFPNETEDDIPSPYCGSSSPITLNSPDSRELAHFEHFSRRELPKLVRRSLEIAVAEDVQLRMLEDRLKNQLVDIIRNCQTQVFNLYQESRRTTPLPQAIIPPPSTNQLINCPELQDIRQNLDNGAPKIINESDSDYHSTSTLVAEPFPQIQSDLGSMRTNVYRLESRKPLGEPTEDHLPQGSASLLPPLESEAIGQREILEGLNELSGSGHDSGTAGLLRYGSVIPARLTFDLAAESLEFDPVLGTEDGPSISFAGWSSGNCFEDLNDLFK